jgi:large subunit ribosomal protein L4
MLSILRRSTLSRSSSLLGRSLSSNVAIPGNLQMADNGKIFQDNVAASKVNITDEEFYFPPLEMEVKSLPIKSWLSPGEVAVNEPLDLDARVFNVAIRKDMVHEMIRYQRAKLRQPHKTKRVGEISGSTRKPFPQKGQGKSQVGNTRNSSWRKGMKAHGPVLRDFSFTLNRKERARALMTVLASMHRQGDLHVFDHFDMPSTKTKPLLEKIYEHKILDKPEKNEDGEIEKAPGRPRRVMLCDDMMSMNMLYAARNLSEVILMPQVRLNVMDLMRYDVLAITSKSLQILMDRLVVQHQYGARSMFYLQQHTLFQTTGLAEIDQMIPDQQKVEE